MSYAAFARIGGKLGAWRHALMACGTLMLVVGGAIGSIALWGDPMAGAPRRVVPLAPSQSEAPRIGLMEAAVDPSLAMEEDASFFDRGIDPLAMAEPSSVEGQATGPDSTGQMRITPVEPTPQQTQWKPSPLARAPVAGLHESGAKGPLPVIAADGRTPAQIYARPFAGDTAKPKIAIVLGGLGFNARLTQAAIEELPAEVTLSFVPYATDLQTWIDRARAQGHEVMIELPMEPYDMSADDTGPQTLLAAASARDNIAKLETVLARATGYFGVTNYQGARFAASSDAAGPVVQALKARGLVFVGNALGPRTALAVEAGEVGLPFTSVDRIIDARREAESIDEQLLKLEALALQNGNALGSGFAYPVTIDQVGSWAENLSMRGYALAPASAVLKGRAGRQ